MFGIRKFDDVDGSDNDGVVIDALGNVGVRGGSAGDAYNPIPDHWLYTVGMLLVRIVVSSRAPFPAVEVSTGPIPVSTLVPQLFSCGLGVYPSSCFPSFS